MSKLIIESYLDFGPTEVPIGLLLVSVTNTEYGAFVKRSSCQLQANG